jgi:hypothetical protein
LIDLAGNQGVYAGLVGVWGEVQQVAGIFLSLYDMRISGEKGLSSFLLCA